MKTITYVEIDIDFCTLTYGVSPCDAALGYTGDKKCFNSRATCQDLANYNVAPKTVRFAVATDYLPTSPQAIPCIESVNRVPTRLRIAEDLGQRASVTVTLNDFFSEDFAFGLDKYRNDRSGRQGTFFGKFRARHPFISGRPLRVKYGVLGQDIATFETHHYIIESASGPANDKFVIVAKDPLKLVDDDKAQVPKLSKGTLLNAINTTDTSATIEPSAEASTYGASGVIAIGKELMDFTRSGSTLTLVRGQYNTVAEEHDAEALIQECKVYGDPYNEQASVIVGDLLTEAGVDASYFDASDWLDADLLVIRESYAAIIAQPTSVKKLIAELSEQAGFTLWWDTEQQKIRFQPLGDTTGDTLVSEDQIIEGSYTTREDVSKRVSQLWVYYRVINPLERLDEPKNYLAGVLTTDLNAESAEEYGQPAIKTIYSRWITERAAVDQLSDRVLRRYRDPPRRFGLAVMADAANKLKLRTGGPFSISHYELQDDEGLNLPTNCVVVGYDRRWDQAVIEAEEFRVTVRSPDDPFIFIIDTDTVNQPAASGQTGFNLRAAFNARFPLIEPDEYTEVEVLIEAGVVVGSDNTSVPAFDVGTWPTGCSITITNNGRIAGAGGNGGFPVVVGGVFQSEKDGEAGGTALYTRHDITVINNGIIAGGGGGGGLGFSGLLTTVGGGGGAGRVIGLGGVAAITGNPGTLTSGGAAQGSAGAGGDPGQAGGNGPTIGGFSSTGGAAGIAIDGDSQVTLSGSGSVLGSQVN